MKKFFLIFILLAIMVSGFAQHPLGESQLLIGNGYFKPKLQEGDGTWRYVEARIIPGQNNNIRAGLYFSAIEVGSRIEGFKHHSTEFGIGLALNFTLTPGWKYEKHGWGNLGYKKSKSEGSIRQTNGLFQSSQEDDLIFLTGGIIFRNTLEAFPFVRQKVSMEYQQALKSKYVGKWEGETILTQPWDNERFKLAFENAIAKINLSWQHETHLLPAIYLAYSHEKGNSKDYGAIGAVLTLAKGEYGKEMINLSYQSKFDLAGKDRINILQVDINILSFFNN